MSLSFTCETSYETNGRRKVGKGLLIGQGGPGNKKGNGNGEVTETSSKSIRVQEERVVPRETRMVGDGRSGIEGRGKGRVEGPLLLSGVPK